MSKIQPEQGSSKSTRPEPKKIPNGWTPTPHHVARDASLSMSARNLWTIIKGRQAQAPRRRIRLETLMHDTGASKRSVQTWLTELKKAERLEIKITGRASYYTALEPSERCSGVHARDAAECMSTKQETLRKKKAKQLPALTTEGAPSRAPTRRVESLSTTATDKTAMRAELLLLSLPAQQRPALTNRTLRVFEKLFDMGYSEPEVLAHLKEAITNPKARAGLTVETLEALTQIPHRESNTAPHTATKAEQQAQELEEVWGSQGEPQEQIDQFEENSREWIAAIRSDLNKRSCGKGSA